MSAVAEEKKIVVGGSFLIEERRPEEVYTPEDFDEEHRMIAETARQFMDNEVRPRIPELEKKDWKLARELVRKGAELGFIGATVAEEYGGLGLDQVAGAILGEALGRAASFATTMGAQGGIGLTLGPWVDKGEDARAVATGGDHARGRVDGGDGHGHVGLCVGTHL